MFTERQKIAIALMTLPPELSAELFKSLAPEEVMAITLEMAGVAEVTPEVRAEICEEFGGNPRGLPVSAVDAEHEELAAALRRRLAPWDIFRSFMRFSEELVDYFLAELRPEQAEALLARPLPGQTLEPAARDFAESMRKRIHEGLNDVARRDR